MGVITLKINPIVDFYDKQSSTYDLIQGYSYWEILYSEYNNLIKRYYPNLQNLRIIDLGCGTGLTSDLLVEKTNHMFGLDITLPLLKRAKKRHEQKLMATQGDITNLPFKDKSFDGVVCLDTLEHIDPIEKAISEISRISKRGGLFLFDIPSSMILDFSYFFGYYGKNGLVSALKGLSQNKVMFEWESLDDNYESRKIKTYRYKPSYFEDLVKSHGFGILEKKGVHISTMLIPEKIQANTASPMLARINNLLCKADGYLNKISHIKNHALYILYACKLNW